MLYHNSEPNMAATTYLAEAGAMCAPDTMETAQPEKVGGQSRAAWIAGVALTVLVAALYIRTVAPSVMPGDYAEFQLSAAILGVPHPTGYPLYVLLGKLFTFLPFGDIAYRVNLSSAVYMAGATGLLYAIAVRLLRLMGLPGTWWAALVGAGLFAVSPTVWSMALVARSYALNALLVGSVVFSLISWRHGGRSVWFYAACLFIGLSLVHHGTNYLLLPAYGLYLLFTEVWRWRHSKHERRFVRWVLGLLSFLLGVSPILFLVYRFLYGGPYYWGNPSTWKDFFDLLTGGPFRGQMMGFGTGLDAQLSRLGFGIGQLSDQFTPLGVAAGLLGWLVLWRYKGMEALLFTLMIAFNFFFAMNYALVGYLYFIPTYLLWGTLIATGAAWLAGLVARGFARLRVAPVGRALVSLAALVLLAATLYAAALRFPGIDQSGQLATRDDTLALLAAAPRGASLYLDWEQLSAVRFYRLVYGLRPDLRLESGDPADWAKQVYCDLSSGVTAYVGKFAGAVPPAVSQDFQLDPAPTNWDVWQVTSVLDGAKYQVPPCGTCATCR